MPLSPQPSQNLCDTLSSDAKIGLTLTVIVAAGLIPLEQWPAQGLLLVVVFVGLSLANVTIGYLVRRLSLFLPMLLVFGLSLPVSQYNKPAAWAWMIGLWLRCTVSFLAGLWMIRVLSFSALLFTLLRWHVPKVLVAMLAFMYRYIFILWDESARLRHARDARDFGTTSIRKRWAGNAQLIGQLLLRAMERAERTHHAMLARGWNGSVQFLGDESRPAS